MGSLRLGLCCQFREAPIKFRNTTVKHSLGLQEHQRLAKLGNLCRMNAESLLSSLKFCSEHKIGDFRVNSQILPLKSHAVAGYNLEDLPGGSHTIELFKYCGRYAKENGVRLSMHPDQFILLSSLDEEVTRR
ncbi:MAG: UV DNA damage repair endonuclease UvsE, partial [Desulfobacterales bacterium]